MGKKITTEDFISKAKEVHGDKYDYSKSEYLDWKTLVVIICPLHGEFLLSPNKHLNGRGCQKCSNKVYNRNFKLIENELKKIHNNRYNYSNVEYVNLSKKVNITCKIHGDFEQTIENHLKRKQGCPSCSNNNKLSVNDFINKSIEVHGIKYDYSLSEYNGAHNKIKIICSIHGMFEQTPRSHLNGCGCPVCNLGFTKQFKLQLLESLCETDLLTLDPIELLTIIKEGKLPTEFISLTDTDSNSDERIVALNDLKEIFNTDDSDESTDNGSSISISVVEDDIEPVDDIDDEITSNTVDSEPQLPSLMGNIGDLMSLDNSLYASMSDEAFELLIQYKLRKLWNDVLNDKINISDIESNNGDKYFTIIKDKFLTEYYDVYKYQPPVGYSFQYQPNLMQKLTVNRLVKNKSYGNWSGVGAGKTISFIISSREIDSKLTLVIALNSTIEQTCNAIKDVYPDSLTYTEYTKDYIFDTSKHNYLVLNYEKFQQGYSEDLFQNLNNNNKIDFIVIDEVHNAKQREEENESIRRGVMSRLIGRSRENNENLHMLVMSATPVINNIYEAKSLLQLMTGFEYNDLNERRTLANALEIFKQLTLNGLRFIPNYDINEIELTGNNLSNLNIDGSHLLDSLLNIPSNRYFEIEKLLLPDKLTSIKEYLRKGVVIYTYFTDGIVNEIKKFVESQGLTVGIYTGEVDVDYRDSVLKKFIKGDIDILIGSKPVGTGVDGLQKVCNRAVMITLPWTDSEYQQFKGRIYRQGSIFDTIEIIIPQVRIELEDNQFWSWDNQRLNIIKNKRTLADACVDGLIPSKVLPKPETLFKKTQESLLKWKELIEGGYSNGNERSKLNIELYPELQNEQRQTAIDSELSEFNRRGKIMRSENMHKEFSDNKESFFRYHALRNQRMEQWDEIPYEYIATKIKNRNHIIADFGCGENKFKNCLPNKVYSFDHVAFDDSVIACDMKNIPLDDESIDIAMFSLSLWGSNYEDYIKESYRVLNYGGMIYIAEPSKSYDSDELKEELKSLLRRNGFEIVGDIENRGKFIYIKGLK